MHSFIIQILPMLGSKLSTFATVFLGIFIEAIPFLLLGTLGSGFVEAFLDPGQIQRFVPRNLLAGALTGSLLGMVFPVCECGVVPLTRRLFNKGLPVVAGMAFLMAAPVLNPIVILSTASAFGWGWMLAGRVGLSMLTAVTTGLLFSVVKTPQEILLPASLRLGGKQPGTVSAQPGLRAKLNQMLVIAADEFFEMGRFLILGASLAAGMQAFIPQQLLLQVGHGPVTSVLVMMALAVLLSICSTVDAFIALGFVSIFSPGAILAFLIFGPMVDIKTTLMYLSVFKKRTVVYLVLLPFLLSLLAGIAINLVVV
ncbi:MAG: permease [Anaerolineales bacterium]